MAVIWSLITPLRLEKETVSRKCCRAPGQGAASQQFPTGREVSALTLCWWNPWLIPTRFSSCNISDKADILRTLWSMTGNSMNCRAQEREAQLNKYPLFPSTKGELIPWWKSQVLLQQFFIIGMCLLASIKCQRGCLCRFVEQILEHPLKLFMV